MNSIGKTCMHFRGINFGEWLILLVLKKHYFVFGVLSYVEEVLVFEIERVLGEGLLCLQEALHF